MLPLAGLWSLTLIPEPCWRNQTGPLFRYRDNWDAIKYERIWACFS